MFGSRGVPTGPVLWYVLRLWFWLWSLLFPAHFPALLNNSVNLTIFSNKFLFCLNATVVSVAYNRERDWYTQSRSVGWQLCDHKIGEIWDVKLPFGDSHDRPHQQQKTVHRSPRKADNRYNEVLESKSKREKERKRETVCPLTISKSRPIKTSHISFPVYKLPWNSLLYPWNESLVFLKKTFIPCNRMCPD